MPRHDYLLSFLLSRLGLLVLEVGLVAGFGALVFQVPMRGSLLSLVLVCAYHRVALLQRGSDC